MKFSENTYLRAESELKRRREAAQNLADIHRAAFVSKYPQLTEIENEIRDAALAAVKSVGSGVKPDIASLAKKNLEAQEKKRLLLKSAGYPEDYLEPHYSCETCSDTGIVNGKLCECHIKLLKKLSASDLSCGSLLEVSTFKTFDVSLYSDKKDLSRGYSPREYMKAAYGMIKNYAESFSRQSPNFIFCGSTGLGKTHLALSVMNTLTENGHNCFYATAWEILKRMQNEHFSKGETISEELYDAELLIIDDLGSEFETQFSKAAVYELLNDSLLRSRPMIIITGLSLPELEERYGQKVISRLSSFEKIEFIGSDIRQIKK